MGEHRGNSGDSATTVSLRRAVEIVCEAGRVDPRDACRALERAFSVRLLVASAWTKSQVRAARVYSNLPPTPKELVLDRAWSGDWAVSWSESKIREQSSHPERGEYHDVEVDETRLRSWIRNHLNWPTARRDPGGKSRKRDAVRAWLLAKYPTGVPPQVKNSALVDEMNRDGIEVSERTLSRALKPK